MNDPDADRLGVAIRTNSNQYQKLTGNQVGIIFLYYLLTSKKHLNQLTSKSTLYTTFVSSSIFEVMAQNFNCRVIKTNTGFK
jgi:phosphoglucomutase